MREELLHFIWKFKLLSENELVTLEGESVTVINPGTANNADGPDFLNSRVKIGNEEWVGNVEIHVNASDWKLHNHSSNPKFKNLILHVVYCQDEEIVDLTFQKTPTLELKGSLPDGLVDRYSLLMSNQNWIPCEDEIKHIDDFIIDQWQDRLLVSRIEHKTKEINSIFEHSNFDWNQTFFEVLLKSFGFKRNAHAFQLLAQKIGFATFKKECDTSQDNIESLILGTAGFLPTSSNHFHIQKLIDNFKFQQSKYKIEVMNSTNWISGGVRPPNQPFVRTIQLITFLKNLDKPLLELFGENVVVEIQSKLKLNPAGYWNSHKKIEQPAINGIAPMGTSSVSGILINSVLPLQFFYAKWTKNQELMGLTVELFERIKPEKNAIIEQWKNLGIRASSAGKTQALLELKNNYCSQKKCLFCAIGKQVLKR